MIGLCWDKQKATSSLEETHEASTGGVRTVQRDTLQSRNFTRMTFLSRFPDNAVTYPCFVCVIESEKKKNQPIQRSPPQSSS